MPFLSNQDLKYLFKELIENNFKDLRKPNSVVLKFGKRAKRRLGSIWYDPINHNSVITITGYLRNPLIPAFVTKAVLAHELVHYFTGFGSASEKKYEHAHRGSVIKKEMASYGLDILYIESEKWIKKNWAIVIRKNSRFNIVTIEKEIKVAKLHETIMSQKTLIKLL